MIKVLTRQVNSIEKMRLPQDCRSNSLGDKGGPSQEKSEQTTPPVIDHDHVRQSSMLAL